MRSALDQAFKSVRDLRDRAHYDRLAKERDARCQALLEELKKAVRQIVDVMGECLLDNNELHRECESLQRRLDVREGRPPKPDALELVEPVLQKLPPEQAEQFRFIVALSSLPRRREQLAMDAFEKASAHLAAIETQFVSLQHEVAGRLEIHAEAVRRGWTSHESLDSYRATVEEAGRQLHDDLAPWRERLHSWSAQREALRRRREELLQALGEAREGQA